MAFPDKPVAHLLGSNGPVHAIAYSAPPGTYVLTGSADRCIRLYNPTPSKDAHEARGAQQQIPQGRLIQTYSGHGYEVLSIDVSADNERFVSAGGDRTVFLWDVATAQRPIQVLADARDAVTALAVRGPEIVAGSVDGRVRSYDVRMGRCTTDVVAASVTSLCLTKDGRAALVGSLDSKLRLMDRDTGACLRAYSHPEWKNEDLRVQSLLGAREKYVVAGDEMTGAPVSDGQGRIWAWDLLSGKLVAKVTVPWGPSGHETKKRIIGKDGKEKPRNNVTSSIAWRDDGWGDQFCVGGTSGVVTVFGT
ncbi:hypothetical protein HIM_00373 [Hirsutella minnesotensis 3608]|nr:hypothetical protein HIM_00373 [Hirsutella minnesotensis 3608]